MKKLIVLISMIAFIVSAVNAQYGKAAKEATGTSDTIQNGKTFSKVMNATGGYRSVVYEPVVTRVSGKVYTWIKLYGSLEGTYYTSAALDSARIVLTTTGTKVAFLNYKNYGAPFCYYKITAANDSTGAGATVVWGLYRKEISTVSP
jgi:hypothetical protein